MTHVMSLDPLRKLGHGAFSEVFDIGGGRVLKAFFAVPPSVAPHADASLIPRLAFRAELEAYLRLADQPDLAIFTPRCDGVADPLAFALRSNRAFVQGCGLLLERIPGRDRKFAELEPGLEIRVDAVLRSMQDRIGIDDPWDGSCFVPGSRAAFTLIDFATPTERLAALDGILSTGEPSSEALARLLKF